MGGVIGVFKSKLVHIVPVEDTYFISVQKPAAKVDKNFVYINFSYLSPFDSGELLYCTTKEYIYIWFLKNKKQKKRGVYIPESYLLYRHFSQKNQDTIIVKKNNQKNEITFLIVKKGNLQAQIIKKKIDGEFIDIIKRKFSLQNPKIIEIDRSHAESSRIEDLLSFINFRDFFYLDFKGAIRSLFEFLKAPLIIFFLMVNLLDFVMYRYINSLVLNKKKELLSLKLANKDIRENYNKLSVSAKFFKKFIKQELKTPNSYVVLKNVYKALLNSDSLLLLYNQYGENLRITLLANSVSNVVKNLVDTGVFENVQVISATQSYQNKNKTVLNLSLKVKNLYKNNEVEK